MKRHKLILFCFGLLMLVSEIWKQWCLTYYLNHGSYNWWYFPFQLCSIPMYICLLAPWVKSRRIYGRLLSFLMDFGLLAGIFTFFDTSGLYYGYAPLTVHSFAWHVLLIILGFFAGLSKEADYSMKGFRFSVLVYLACCLFATGLNLAFYRFGSINMFYISPRYPMTQKVFGEIALLCGNTAGILIYIFTIAFGAFLLHLLWRHFLRSASGKRYLIGR